MRPRISITGSVRPSVRPSDGQSDGWSVTRFFLMLKMSGFLHENHWDSPVLTLVNVFGVLGYLYVLNSGWHVNSVKHLHM